MLLIIFLKPGWLHTYRWCWWSVSNRRTGEHRKVSCYLWVNSFVFSLTRCTFLVSPLGIILRLTKHGFDTQLAHHNQECAAFVLTTVHDDKIFASLRIRTSDSRHCLYRLMGYIKEPTHLSQRLDSDPDVVRSTESISNI